LIKALVIPGFVLIVLGVLVLVCCPYTYSETVKTPAGTAIGEITDVGYNPLGLWLSILGLAFVVVGSAPRKTT